MLGLLGLRGKGLGLTASPCPALQPVVVLEAVALTAGVVAALTAYAFYATRKGRDFRCGLRRPIAHNAVL